MSQGPQHGDQPSTNRAAPVIKSPSEPVREGTRYGTCTLFKELVQAPGCILAEGRNPAGEPVLLQLVPLTEARDAAAISKREDYVHMVARATELLAAHESPRVLANGLLQAEWGDELYWVLPWIDGAQRLGFAQGQVESSDHLVQAACGLLERVQRRHDQGRLFPLLSASTVLLHPSAGVDVAGLQVHLPSEWLKDGLEPSPLAPEETADSGPTRSGDLWRVGTALLALASGLQSVPAAFLHLVERLSAIRPDQRFSDADDALMDLEALQNTIAGSVEEFARSLEGPNPAPELNSGDFPALPKFARGNREEQPTVPSQDLPLDPAATADDAHQEAAADLAEEELLGIATLALDAEPAIPAARPSLRGELAEEDEDEDEDLELDTSPQFPSPIGAERSQPSPSVSQPSLPTANKNLATVRMPFPDDSKTQADPEQVHRPSRDLPEARVTHMAAPLDIPEGETLLEIRRPERPVAKTPVIEDITGDENTLHDVSLQELADREEFPTQDEIPRKKAGANVWERAKKDVAIAPSKTRPGAGRPLPPKVNPIGPAGTLVGARLINDPTGLRSHEELPGLLPPPTVGQGAPEAAPPPPADPLMPAQRALLGPDNSGPAALEPFRPPTQDLMAPPPGLPPTPRLLPAADGLASPIPGSNPPHQPQPQLRPAPAPAVASARIQAPPPAPPRLNMFLGALGFFVAGGLATFFAPSLIATSKSFVAPEPSPHPPAAEYVLVQATNEVMLQVSPASAVVVTESDGRLLGRTPMRFLVPPNSNIAVYVTAAGHEPQRLVLPERGRIRADLVPLSSPKPCFVNIKPPPGVAIKGVAALVTEGESQQYQIQGAALVQANVGMGAWLIRCPELGGTRAVELSARIVPTDASIRVDTPSNATIYVEGKEVGTTPKRVTVQGGFRRIGIEKLSQSDERVERWVPIFQHTRLQMPRPRSKLGRASSPIGR